MALIYDLVPGFLAAWVFYALTAHPRPSAFERIVQALIFTVIVRVMTIVARKVVHALSDDTGLPAWTDGAQLVWSVVIALLLGLVFATVVNRDWFHGLLRKIGCTSRTSFPSEWYSAFARESRYVVLHLCGERRLYGWPEEWPDAPEVGHFLIMQPQWLLEDGKSESLDGVERIAVAATDVEMIEFLKYAEETATGPRGVRQVDATIAPSQEKEESNGD